MTTDQAKIRIRGVTATITYRLDGVEHVRRQADGCPRLRDIGTLDALMDYPENLPVPYASLSKGQRTLITRGLLEHDGTNVVRRIRPPLAVDFALVHAKSWRTGLERAGNFGAYCNRGMVVPQLPADPAALAEADFWGIHVYTTGAGGELVEHVAPREFVRWRHTPAYWWFLEQVYRQVADVPAAVCGGAG